ncbi:MAG TPA: hypothetical protein VK072_09250 [Candidatus Avamphibacillus sp.]|nr:hypothetical protein [Candidatus Avamphibacillus sp.]
MKQLQAYLPLMRQYISIDHIPMLSMKLDFRPFTKEAMTAVMFGYRYEEIDGE